MYKNDLNEQPPKGEFMNLVIRNVREKMLMPRVVKTNDIEEIHILKPKSSGHD